jgi:hypothetical protein
MPHSVEFEIIGSKIELQCCICNGTIKWWDEETNKIISFSIRCCNHFSVFLLEY